MSKSLKYVSEFKFPSEFGFGGSAGKTMVKGYARGGAIGKMLTKVRGERGTDMHAQVVPPGATKGDLGDVQPMKPKGVGERLRGLARAKTQAAPQAAVQAKPLVKPRPMPKPQVTAPSATPQRGLGALLRDKVSKPDTAAPAPARNVGRGFNSRAMFGKN